MYHVLFILFFIIYTTLGDESTHHYKEGEQITLWVNKVSPFDNPQETYEYYSLPFCAPTKKIGVSESLGESLSGFELHASPMEIKFKTEVSLTKLCSVHLTKEKTEAFVRAVSNRYWFEFFFDDLPIWGWVGTISEKGGVLSVYTHYDIKIFYNDDQIITVKLDEMQPAEIHQDTNIDFSYSVQWLPTAEPFEERFDKYLEDKFFEHQVHWFSVFNSVMMVIFLAAVVVMILMRTLRKDFTDYEDPKFDGEETGWKKVSGDVFRPPPHLMIFSALIGAGSQLFILVFSSILLTIVFYYNHPFYRRGTIVSIFLALYAITAVVAGYVSGSYYKKNGGKDFLNAMLLTALVFPTVICTLAFLLNFIALYYGSLAHIPFGTMVAVVLIWVFVALPLTLAGTYLGRHFGDRSKQTPCRVKPVPKSIPPKRFHQQLWIHILAGGVLPFGSIFIEMYFVLTAFWQSKFYYVFGFLLVVYLILTVVSICVTIVATYFLLNAEDYRWQWSSFLGNASTAVYVFLYAVYFFFKTKMSGVLQVSFYFGYTLMFCFALSLITGAVGFFAAQYFVYKIFSSIHTD